MHKVNFMRLPLINFRLMTLKQVFLIIISAFSSGIGNAQIGIQVNGNWSYALNSTDLTEAGSDFSGTYASASNQILIDITYPSNANVKWEVHVEKQDIDWHSDLDLYVRRTGNGTGQGGGNSNGFVQLGTSYQLITNNSQFFFKGRKKRFDIPIQYEIRGVSVLIPAKTYETTIIYTVTEQ